MKIQAKHSLLILAALLVAAPAALAGKGGKRIKSTQGSGDCLQLGAAIDQLEDSVEVRLFVADRCDGERKQAGAGHALFEVRRDGSAACGPDEVQFDDLGSIEHECDVQLPEPGESVRLEACIEAEADALAGKRIDGSLSGRQCWSLELAAPTD